MQLIDRLKAATGPDRALNIAIFKFLHPEYADFVEGRGGLVHSCDGADQRVLSDVRPDNYTASIDAALALVERMLPEMLVRLSNEYQGYWVAEVSLSKSPQMKTPALAILIALFTALQGKDKP